MKNFDFLLGTPKGKKKTKLDHDYRNHVISVTANIDQDDEARWEIYNIIISRLLEDKKTNAITEIKYRITDGENPNKVILDILERENDDIDNMVWGLKKKISEFLEEDFMKQFLI